VGRGTWQNANSDLPDDYDRTGIWVDMTTSGGIQFRILYLPGVGEAEDYVQKNGRWVLINHLVSRGFTDVPARKTESQTP
jgi:hypothetical protein